MTEDEIKTLIQLLERQGESRHLPLGMWKLCGDAASALTQLLAERQGQPIETAPKDGTTILVYFKTHGWISASWTDPDYGPESAYALWHVDDFKHGPYAVRGYSEGDDLAWMPLPAAAIAQVVQPKLNT